MGIHDNIERFRTELAPFGARLVAVSKTHPADLIRDAYQAGQRLFGENKVQELTSKAPLLPADIEWHFIGHLQRNKVRALAPAVTLIHSVDSLRLLQEIEKEGARISKPVACLLQIYIAREETKFGLDRVEVMELLASDAFSKMKFVRIEGLMGMASLTDNEQQIATEFRSLRNLFDELKSQKLPGHCAMKELSMGMSSDYTIALKEGSSLVRIGTAIFGERTYSTQTV